jgi:hypothetical protein
MGALSELADDVPLPQTGGPGGRLLEWWAQADDADRALLQEWARIVDSSGRLAVPADVIAEKLTAAGCPIAGKTVIYGLRRLRRTEWAS